MAETASCCLDISTEGIDVTESGTTVGVLWADIFSSSVDAVSVCTLGTGMALSLASSEEGLSSSDMEDGLVEGATDEPCVCADVGEEAECMSSGSVRALGVTASVCSCGNAGFESWSAVFRWPDVASSQCDSVLAPAATVLILLSSSSRALRASICFFLSSKAFINRCFSGVTPEDLCCKLL